MPAEIDTGGPRVLHNHECPIPFPWSISTPEKTGDSWCLKGSRIFSDLRRQKTCSEGLLDLDSSPKVRRRRFKRSRRSEVVFEKVKEKVDEEIGQKEDFSNVSRIHDLVCEDDLQVRFEERPELRDSFEIANQRPSSTTCHVIANRESYRYSETCRSPKTNIGVLFFNKLKGRFRSAEWFEPGISWTTVFSERKTLVSSHPCSKEFVCPRSNPLTLEGHRDYSREVKIAPLNVGIDQVHLEIDPLHLGFEQLNVEIDPVRLAIDEEIDPINPLKIAPHLTVSRDTSSSVRKKRKKRGPCFKNPSYFQLAVLLFLITFGQSGLLTSGVLSFQGKHTGLSVLTIGMVIGAVGAAPVDLIGDTGIREARSANLSHITGASRKIQMYIKNRYLQILPDGTVNGSNDDVSDNTIFQRTSVSRGQLRIQGVATCLYLCMDSCGLLYGSHEYTEDCLFNETLEQHNYNTYSSVRWSTNRKTTYLGLNRYGEPRRVQAKGHNLGRLSAYARVLTVVVPPDRVEALQKRMQTTHHSVRHQHNAHHDRNQQQNLCPWALHRDKDNRDKFRCRKRKKRKKRKRKCRKDEVSGSQCEHHVDPGSSEGLPESKRSCEGAASDEVCRRQALDAASKKRKSRMEKVDSVGRNQSTIQQKGSKKGKKQPSTKKSNSGLAEHEDEKEKKPNSMNGKKKAPGFKRTSLQAKKRLPGRTTSSAVPKEPPSTSPSSWFPGASTTESTEPACADGAPSKLSCFASSSSVKDISGSSVEDTSGSTSKATSSPTIKDILRAVSTNLTELSSSVDSSEDSKLNVSYSDEELQTFSSESGGVTINDASVEVSEDESYASTPSAMELIKAGKVKDSTRRLAM